MNGKFESHSKNYDESNVNRPISGKRGLQNTGKTGNAAQRMRNAPRRRTNCPMAATRDQNGEIARMPATRMLF
jgi:hypothetical protein